MHVHCMVVGGGSMPELTELEQTIIDFFVDKKSMTIKGIVGGVESAVRHLFNCCIVLLHLKLNPVVGSTIISCVIFFRGL